MSLALFPEELLERILAHTVIAPASPHPRAPWHTAPSSAPSSAKQTRGRTAPLLVSRAFHRIALSHFYHTLVLHSPHQSAAVLQTLRARPFLAPCVRTLVLPCPSAEDAEVFKMLERVDVLDVTLPNADSGAVEDLAAAIQNLRGLRALTIRKAAGTYLNQPAPRAILDALADAVTNCPELHTATLTFPLSGDPALSTLTAALSAAPALTTLRTPLPALWAPAYAVVAANPGLARICLGDDLGSPTSTSPCPSAPSSSPCAVPACGPSSKHTPPRAPERRPSFPQPSNTLERKRPILPTALFLSAARRHARLTELVRAGTDIAAGGVGWRGRAATVGSC